MQRHSKRGMGLVEVVIGAAIITLGILALIESYTIYVRYALGNSNNVKAAYLAEEALEVMTHLRDEGWTARIAPLAVNTPYYLSFNGTDWATTLTPQYVDGNFLRTITLADVLRDSNGVIVQPGGTDDPSTKKVTVTIEYFQGFATTTRSIATYLSNLNAD